MANVFKPIMKRKVIKPVMLEPVSTLTGSLPVAPAGFVLLTGADGAYLLGADGAYLLGVVP